MKIRIIPDIHGHDWWKELVNDIDTLDYCIFLGDYVDDWDAEDEVIINNLLDVIEFKKSYSDKVVLLYGNHEFNNIEPYVGYCSGFRNKIYPIISLILKENKNLFQICKCLNISLPLHSFPNQKLLFSHAGFSKNWIKENYYWIDEEHYKSIEESDWKNFKDFKLDNLEELINQSFNSYKLLDKVMQVGYPRGGCSLYGGPLWADLTETLDKNILGFRQFVGHTPLKELNAKNFSNPQRHPENTSITFCDCGSKKIDLVLDITDSNIILHSNDLNIIIC